MTDPPFRLAPLGAEHDRDSFDCGEEALDRYLKTQATQDIRRRVANCFVATESAGGLLAGYYTIASAGIPFVDLPAEESIFESLLRRCIQRTMQRVIRNLETGVRFVQDVRGKRFVRLALNLVIQ